MSQTIAIGGFMGVGKSTVGRLLAGRLSVPFVDLDEAIEKHSGHSVSHIFEAYGEEHFRELEEKVLKVTLEGPPIVLALGGGTLHQSACLAQLQAHSKIIVLWLPLDGIRHRLGGGDAHRPLWAQAKTLFEERERGYKKAGILLDVQDMEPEDVVNELERVVACA